MYREIKFRGKSLVDGEWWYGDLFTAYDDNTGDEWYCVGDPHGCCADVRITTS